MERGGLSIDSLQGAGHRHGPIHPRSRSPPGTGMIGGSGPGSPGSGTGVFIPETYLEPSHPNNNSIPSLRQKTGPGGRILEQHDSGVADVNLEGYRPSHTSSSSSPSPRGMNGFVMPQMGPNTGNHGNRGLRPDSLAYTNEYEELPSAKYLDPNSKYSYAHRDEIPPDPGLSPPPLHRSTLVNTSTENLCRGNTPDKPTNTYRRRQNPLYEDTNFGHSTGMKKSDEELESKKPDCFCPILIIVGILAFLTFLLVILLITNTLPGSRRTEPEYALVMGHSNQTVLLRTSLEALQQQYDALLVKVDRLEKIVGPLEDLNETSIDRGLIASLQIKVSKLENETGIYRSESEQMQTDLESRTSTQFTKINKEFEKMEQETQTKTQVLQGDIDSNTQQMAALDRKLQESESRTNRTIIAVQNDLQARIASMSQVPGPPGPQGPPGVGNLSLCEGKLRQSGVSSAFESTRTGWVPSDVGFAQNWVIMGATCSVDGGTLATLLHQTGNSMPGVDQYQCECTGEIAGKGERYCIMYYWVCPRIS